MSRMILLLLSLAALPQATSETNFHIVSYAEVAAASRERAVAAFRGYAEASRKEEGYVRSETFEQTGRPGHFLLIETWRDSKAYDARGSAVQKQLTDSLAPIRLSNYDQRPYKTMTSAAPKRPPNRQTVFVISHVDVSMDPKVPGLLERLADASRKEEENLRFDVLQHTMRANHFTVIEAWENEKAREAHATSAHVKQYRDDLAPFLGSPLDERVYAGVGN